MKLMTRLLCLIALLPFTSHASSAQVIHSEQHNFTLEQVIDGLGVPWGLAFISKNQLLITEREGNIKLLDTQRKTLTPIQGAPEVMVEGQAGLLDVAVPPNFKRGDWIYFTFVRSELEGGVTVLARAKLTANHMAPYKLTTMGRFTCKRFRHQYRSSLREPHCV